MPVTNDLITREECCSQYEIEISFLDDLHEYGLIEVVSLAEGQFIHTGQLQELEKLIRLHYDLEVNTAGLDVISNLLNKLKAMHREMTELRQRLYLFGAIE